MEQHKYIMIGNHRDSWIFGAVDPGSGSSVLLETGRTLSVLLQNGWKPRRSIILSSWDGEEQGMIGSTWDTETLRQEYNESLIVYLNVDMAVSRPNPSLLVASSPILRSAIREATSLIFDPNTNLPLSEVWSGNFSILGSGSDYVAFLDNIGVSSADLRFGGSYGQYHSRYDSFYLMKNLIDPNFTYHKTITQLFTLLVYSLSTNPLLPFNETDLADELQTSFDQIKDKLTVKFSSDNSFKQFDFDKMQKSITNFLRSTKLMNDLIDKQKVTFDQTDLPQKTIELNNALYLTERQFITQEGLPGRPFYKHILQSVAFLDGYNSDRFPGVIDAINDGDIERAIQQFNVIQSKIDSTTKFIDSVVKPKFYTEYIILIVVFGLIFVALIIVIIRHFYIKKRQSYAKF
eukprot:gnl/Spiro4/1520_TR821_c0_g1_i1.p1 gnl/Spiro4/1520_TR821_c0_g1~~gnl/Spiro4/1520_TR821_c0_g1_i1.p1  ORF type:complete len:404 (+),score=-50.35 gnl/Spiro4/1520_TR821_c0_g1_i1:490-1701(+)